MLLSAEKDGVTLKGRKVLTNVSLDITRSETRVSVTYCADIIEFIK